MTGSLVFDTPWLLAVSALLPIIWIILRVTPPATRKLVFPAASLLAGLTDLKPQAAKTPLWLLLLRILAVALLIAGFAGPKWRASDGDGLSLADSKAMLIVIDAGWGSAPDWQQRQKKAVELAQSAGDRPVAVLIADGRHAGPLVYSSSTEAVQLIRTAKPASWGAQLPALDDEVFSLTPAGHLASFWLSDGVERKGGPDWAGMLAQKGSLTVVGFPQPVHKLFLSLDGGQQPAVTATRMGGDITAPAPEILAIGPDPQGTERILARLAFGQPKTSDGLVSWTVPLDLPVEIRNRTRRFEIEGVASAGAVLLADTRTSRPKLAITGHFAPDEAPRLLDPAHYLRNASRDFADIVEGSIPEVLQTAPDVVVLIDTVLPEDESQLARWVADGGRLIRFSGPRMAASPVLDADPLLPVKLLAGGRETGGALSWGEPRGLGQWPQNSPFSGLAGSSLAVRAQLVAEPGPDLQESMIAVLEDMTPLATKRDIGKGQVIMFHVTADPSWSDLPLSGMFPALLERLIRPAAGAGAFARTASPDPREQAEADFWRPEQWLDGWGRLGPAPDTAEPVPASRFAQGDGPDLPPGIYEGEGRIRAVNAGEAAFRAARWPADARQLSASASSDLRLGGWLLVLAGLLFALDVIGSSAVSGGLLRRKVAR